MRGWAIVAAVLLTGSSAACATDAAAPMARDTFVEVMVALRQAAHEATSQEDFESRKEAILQRSKVTEAQLRAYARQAPRQGRELTEAYDSIVARLTRIHMPD